ncbi:MAG: hypothetical protein EBR82_31200 [Caulobacteraceae bacterium]|nr:hypothetical protein [Caulobacteraceae bacterium]
MSSEPSSFRHGAHGREALAKPGEGGNHIHHTPSRRVGLGCITSRKERTAPATVEERIAFELGITVAEVRRRLANDEVT